MISLEEQRRYKAIYSSGKLPKYGHSAHGMAALPIIKRWAPASLLDVGCGGNEFCKSAREKVTGIRAIGCDFAHPDADVNACATSLPFLDKEFDTVSSFDCLEHLLIQQVDVALAEMARVSRRFVFSISYVDSVNGWEGETLHRTVRPQSWWIQRIMHAGGVSIQKQGRYITGEWITPLRLDPKARVVLCGNGPSILTCRGEDIDGHDVVIRLNEYRLAGLEHHVGSRTDLWATFGLGMLPGDAQRPSSVIFVRGERGQPAYEPERLYRIPGLFYQKVRRWTQDRHSFRNGLQAAPDSLQATTGMTVLCWLLHVVGVECVTLAGFDHFRKERSRQHHYWDPKSYGRPREHDGDCEAAMCADLAAAGRVRYL